jgi:hypothetical protein
MPTLGQPRDLTAEEWLTRTENARRAARYRAAEERVRKIVAGDPPLTLQQRAHLAAQLLTSDGQRP